MALETLGVIGTMTTTKRIGLLMGSFDPMHIGHLNMIRQILSNDLVDKVVIVPCFQNPWKKNHPASFDDRIEIIKKEVEWFGKMVDVSNIEASIEPPYYSYKSLSALRKEYPEDELYIICGTDVADKIHLWKNYDDDIRPYFGVIVVDRTDSDGGIKISSTQIREMLKDGKEVYPYVPEKALKYILENKIYG